MMPDCDRCNKNPASVFLTQIAFGETRKLSLCERCARLNLPEAAWTSYPAEQGARQMMSLTNSEMLHRPPNSPCEVAIVEPITLRDLAIALNVKFYQIIAILMQHEIYKSADSPLDFATASLVCERFGVTPHRAA